MSRVHDAMRNLEKTAPEKESAPVAASNLVGALIGELADEVPDDPNLETLVSDLLSASRAYEHDKKKDLALRFYLAMRSALRAYELLQERLKKAEKRNRAHEAATIETPEREEQKPEVRALEPAPDAPQEQAIGHHA